MSDALIVFLVIYVVVAVILLIVGVLGVFFARGEPRMAGDEDTERLGARLILGALVWPVLAAYYLIPAVTYLWETADFDRKDTP